MYVFLISLIIIAAVLLVLVVLIQNSKGGGLAAGFQAQSQIMGAKKTTEFTEKATWVLVGSMALLCVLASWVGTPKSTKTDASQAKQNTTQQKQSAPVGAPQK